MSAPDEYSDSSSDSSSTAYTRALTTALTSPHTGFNLPGDRFWKFIEKRTWKAAEFKRKYFEDIDEKKKIAFIHRVVSKEQYFKWSGDNRPSSLRTICRSKQEIKLMLLGFFWLGFQFQVYALQANYLVQHTLNDIPPMSPSYPGNVSKNGTNSDHEALYDIGFSYLPDYSYRPPWLKVGFVDLNVYVGQFLPWPILLFTGKTKDFVDYVGILGCINMLKGVIQLVTILPPARQGEACWNLNFKQEQLDVVTKYPFENWIWKDFPEYFIMGAAHGCNDMLWSGHTAQTILGWLFITNGLWVLDIPHYKVWVGIIAIYIVGYMGAVLLLRMHYTIDVLVGALLAYFMSTHWTFRMRIWIIANQFVRNDDPPAEEDLEEHDLEEHGDWLLK